LVERGKGEGGRERERQEAKQDIERKKEYD
jgi:hypothetical protein